MYIDDFDFMNSSYRPGDGHGDRDIESLRLGNWNGQGFGYGYRSGDVYGDGGRLKLEAIKPLRYRI